MWVPFLTPNLRTIFGGLVTPSPSKTKLPIVGKKKKNMVPYGFLYVMTSKFLFNSSWMAHPRFYPMPNGDPYDAMANGAWEPSPGGSPKNTSKVDTQNSMLVGGPGPPQ